MHDHDGDKILFSVFEQIGVNFNRPRRINFFFVFPEQSKANAASAILKQRNMNPQISEITQPWWKRWFASSKWSVMVSREMTLDRDVIMKMTTLFQQIATRCNGVYDGWEASVEGENLNLGELG